LFSCLKLLRKSASFGYLLDMRVLLDASPKTA
jgi:hypothetical protein